MWILKQLILFQRIFLNKHIEEKYPRYELYAYGEGFVTEKLRRKHFTGIPVLFIPGNAGSPEQGLYYSVIHSRKN